VKLAATLLLLTATAAHAASPGTRVAMAVALMDVVADHCHPALAFNAEQKALLLHDFRDYDVGGLASGISAPLNRFYDDFAAAARHDVHAFCAAAPEIASRTGYAIYLDRP